MSEQQEPEAFDRTVRQPGLAHLAHLASQDRKGKLTPYWNRMYDELHVAYHGICAYTCFFMPDRATVDHFRPQYAFRKLAYEWSNYRLSSPRANQFKGTRDGILDPFAIKKGLFVLELPSGLVSVCGDVEPSLGEKARYTIKVLKLNDDDYLVKRRVDIIKYYVKGEITRAYLQKMNPFIFDEISRQGLWDSLSDLFKV